MVLTVLVLNLYATDDHPVPTWMRDFLLIFVARLLGMCDTARTYREAKDASAVAQRIRKARNGAGLNFFVRASLLAGAGSRKAHRRKNQTASPAADSDDSGSATVLELQPSAYKHQYQEAAPDENLDGDGTVEPTRRLSTNMSSMACSGEVRVAASTPTTPKKDAASVPLLSAPVSTRSIQPQAAVNYAKDWKRVAEIVDRLFFWLFLLAIILSTLALFHPLTTLVVRRKASNHL